MGGRSTIPMATSSRWVPDRCGRTNDEVYFVVRRTNSSGTVRFVERLMPRFRDDTVTLNKTYAVDAGLYYSGSPRQTFTGLGHLEGMDIVYLADGETLEGEAIVNGQLELSGPVSELSVGCIYTMEFIPSNLCRRRSGGSP
jgi:hypothetical protein